MRRVLAVVGFVIAAAIGGMPAAFAGNQQPTPSEKAALDAYRQGEFSRAVNLYTKALAETADPTHRAQLQVRIAWTLFALGRQDEVPTHLRAALLEDPDLTLVPDYYTREFLDLFDKIKQEIARGASAAGGEPAPDLEATLDSIHQRLASGSDLEGALADVRRLIRFYPTDGRLRPLQLALLEKLGRKDEAEAVRRQLAAASAGATAAPEAPQIGTAVSVPELVLRANRLLDEGDTDGSLVLLRRAVAKQPSNVAALELLAEAAGRAGRWEEAEFALKSALGLQKDNLELQLRLGETYLARGQLSAARDVFQPLTEKHPHSDRAWAALGLLDARLEQYDRATTELARALKENPLLPEAQLAYGELLLSAGRPRKALAAFESAANLLQDDPQLEARTGQVLLALGRAKEALPHLQSATDGGFAPPDVKAALVLAEIERGLWAKARRDLEKSDLSPADGESVLRGLLRLGEHDLKPAQAAFRDQLHRNPNDPRVLDLLGVVLYREGRFGDAIPVFERAHELDRDDALIAENLGRARAAAAADALMKAALGVPSTPQ